MANRTKQCDRQGCHSPAQWQVGLDIYAPAVYGPHPPAQARMSLYVCDSCRKDTTVEDILTDEGWRFLCDSIVVAGKVRPSRQRTKIVFYSEWTQPGGL